MPTENVGYKSYLVWYCQYMIVYSQYPVSGSIVSRKPATINTSHSETLINEVVVDDNYPQVCWGEKIRFYFVFSILLLQPGPQKLFQTKLGCQGDRRGVDETHSVLPPSGRIWNSGKSRAVPFRNNIDNEIDNEFY